MKIYVKTLKGTHFEIEVKPEDSVADVKKNIESVQGSDVYPAAQQMLIHQGKVLTNGTTLEENKVAADAFVVIMLSKNKSSAGESSTAPVTKSKSSSGEGSNTSTAPATKAPVTSVPPPVSTAPEPPVTSVTPPASVPSSAPDVTPNVSESSDVYGEAASNLVAGSNLEGIIQQILDMGGGTWDRAIVLRALRAAYNNPERAVEYLYSGIPEQAEAPPVARVPPVIGQGENPPAQLPQQTQAAEVPSGGPNANPLDLFPQGLPNIGSNAAGAGTLDFLRNSQQFQALRAMVQANPQILQPMLQELGKQNPNLMRLIQNHQADFLRLINEPVEGGQGNILGPSAVPQSISVTPEERDAIERLEAMGFERALVMEVFFACNKNEELAANYLLDHMHEFED